MERTSGADTVGTGAVLAGAWATMLRVVGEGANSTPDVVRTGSGATTSPTLALRFSGIPKLTALWRIWLVGDIATCPAFVGDGCASGSRTGAAICGLTNVLAGCGRSSSGPWLGKKGLIETVDLPVLVGDMPAVCPAKDPVTAGVTGDHGGLPGSVEQAQGEGSGGEAAEGEGPKGKSREAAPAIWMTARLAGIFIGSKASI
mmetsp:Transcript_70919/g.163965  ORF Transcript_70919/g.163965 Transcript_70919/m.163965 type:complete len:202 (-) Transcript_70919:62-667(-)